MARGVGQGTLASYNINYRPFPIFESKDPQVIALVELDEGVRMMSNIVDVEPLPENLELGMRLAVRFEPRGDQFLPVFTPDELTWRRPACTREASRSSAPPRPSGSASFPTSR
jgi:uncharacterized OB-fold protein